MSPSRQRGPDRGFMGFRAPRETVLLLSLHLQAECTAHLNL